MSERQTFSYLSQQLNYAGVRPKTKYGQNFLIDLNLLDLLVRSGEIENRDVVLEVGTGAGSLTSRMALMAGQVVTIEIDPELANIARRELASYGNVTLLQTDALKNKNTMQEEILEELRSKMSQVPNARFKLIANLPYNIATPLISNLLTANPRPELMVITIQKELAERITAKPRTKDYSALSIWMQSQCDCEIVRIMAPSVFWPRPKVDSAILKVRFNEEKRARIVDVEFFHQTVRALFFHRRKFLRSTLISAMKDQLSREVVDQILVDLGFGPEARAEELSIEQMIELVDRCRLAKAN